MRSHCKRIAAAALLAAGASSADVAIAADFSDRTLRGTWALFVEGHSGRTTARPLPTETPLFAVATVTFDGRGGCESRDRIVIGNQYIPDDNDRNAPVAFRGATDCFYAVEPDGTGSFTVTFPDAGPTVATFVIRNRRELFFIANNTVLGVYGGGTMKRR